jgi:hypothetical protein
MDILINWGPPGYLFNFSSSTSASRAERCRLTPGTILICTTSGDESSKGDRLARMNVILGLVIKEKSNETY